VRKLIFALALGAILIPNHGFTLGLGEIEVNSSLNQKLVARIDLLSAAPEDAESLIVKLASREEFVRAGLDRPVVLGSLKFKTSVEDDHVYINVLSPKPIREPFLNFLVEVDWPKGHLIREYTILLDPPVFAGSRQKSAPVSGRPAMRESTGSAPVSVQSPVSDDFRPAAQSPGSVEPVAVATEAFASEPVQQQTTYAAPGYSAPSYSAPSGHRIQAGDTAWSIANRTKPASVSTQQMLIAMLRTNPEVFIDGNVNGLKKGYILRAPDNATINAINHEEAMAAVSQQNALWREYQQSLSSEQPASAIDENFTESEYSSAINMNDDSRLSIVSAGSGSSASGETKDPSEMTAGELREQLALSRERVETERVEKETLEQQMGSLSTQVDKMKGLMTIEDDAMAEMQSVGDSSDEAALALDEASEKIVVEDVVAEEEVVEPTGSAEEQAIDALDALIGGSDDEKDSAAEELFVDETDAAAAVDAGLATEQEVLDEMAPASAIPVPQEDSLVDTLLNNRMILAILLLVVLVVGAIVYLIKRRRENNTSSDTDSSGVDIFSIDEEAALEDVADMVDDESIDNLVSDAEVEASMAEAEAEEEEFDAEATMILPSGTGTVVAPAASLQAEVEEEEQDDVLAEADVYLAYGIYQQAEELLENAIKENPDKDSYRVKLAETYFAGKNADALAKLGVEMKQRVGNSESVAWTKVATLGKELCPDEEVFQQADSDATLDVNDLMPKSPEPMDFDLGEDDGVAELDMDFDTPLEEPADDGGFELPSMDLDMDETAVISPADSAESLDELEFDLSETDAIEETPLEETALEEEFSLDIEASELDLGTSAADESLDAGLDMDLDMDMDMGLDMSADVESVDDAESSMDFDLDMSVDDAEGEIDLTDEVSDFDMSLDDAEGEIDFTEEASDLGLSMDDDLGGMDLSEPLDAEEVNTKLDLAKAYLDMGDHEGARDILDEVVAGGNAEQKKEAQELMAQVN